MKIIIEAKNLSKYEASSLLNWIDINLKHLPQQSGVKEFEVYVE